MQINLHRVKNLSYFIIENFFTENELVEVNKEIKDLKRFAQTAEKTFTAKKDDTLLKTGSGLFLDEIYNNNREASPILQGNRKIFDDEIVFAAEDFDAVFGFLKYATQDATLLNYYASGEEYKGHRDHCRISAVTFLGEGSFSGGEFIFPDQNIVIEAKYNTTVVFPSCVMHKARPTLGQGTRVTMAQFISYGPAN